MASSKEYMEFVAEQMRGAGEITWRKMFGEYGVYCDGKMIGTVEGDQLYLKITDAGKAVMPEVEIDSPHEGARYFRIDDVEDQETLTAMVRATWEALPMAKPKAPKKSRESKKTREPKNAGEVKNVGEPKEAPETVSACGSGESPVELVRVTEENLSREHICCAIAKADDVQVKSKKAWMSEALSQGLVFLKGDVRGKCFIEYMPAEAAWAPVEAPNCMYINCFWVSGQWKGKGLGNRLLAECIRDSRGKGKRGLVVLSSKKKQTFLSDPKYLKYKGFITVDEAKPGFELLYLPLDGGDGDGAVCGNGKEPTGSPAESVLPRFRPQAKEGHLMNPQLQWGFTLFYTQQCPFTAKYVPLVEEAAAERGIPLTAILLATAAEAQAAASPFSTYSLFYNGTFVTNEVLSVPRFLKIAEQVGAI